MGRWDNCKSVNQWILESDQEPPCKTEINRIVVDTLPERILMTL